MGRLCFRAAAAAALTVGAQGANAEELVAAATDGTRASSVSIQRVNDADLRSSAAVLPPTETYIDLLIDPDRVEQLSPVSGYGAPGAGTAVFHSIEAAAYYRDNNEEDGNFLDTGIDYLGFLPTTNYGDFRLNLVALDEEESDFFNRSDSLAEGSFTYERQQGLRRYSLQQLGLPLTQTVNMDNIVGTHRQSRNQPFRGRVTIVNQRFGSSEPDILGITSRVYSNTTGVAVSGGKLGDTFGTVLPGFVESGGEVIRLLGHHATGRHTLSADAWETSGIEEEDFNRTGTRLNWQAIWADDMESSTTIATSDDSTAVLFGLADRYGNLEHDGGIYYFERDFTWIDTQIGDDFVGGYYRVNHNYRTLYYSGVFEQRRDGIESDSLRKRDTTYAALTGNYRMSRSDSVSSIYTFRHIEDRSDLPRDISSTFHSLRGVYSRQHTVNTSSNIGATMAERESDRYGRLYYDLFHDFSGDSSAQLGLEYDRAESESLDSDAYRVDLSWHQYFYRGGTLSIGTGYNYRTDDNGNNSNWTGYLNYDISFARQWTFSAQLDYNRAEYEIDNDLETDPDQLFTDIQFDDRELLESEQFTALVSLRYNIGEHSASPVLGRSGLTRGAGSVIGRLFLDANGDGIAQADEKGLEGALIYLDSVYPITTGRNGEFAYDAVAPGKHHLFIDESALPLPWHVGGREYHPLHINLRATTRVNIPVRKL